MSNKNVSVPAVLGPHGPMAVWDREALANLVGENPALHNRLLMKFLLSAEAQVSAAMCAANQGPDGAKKIGDIAHVLKSTARSVGAMQMGEVCDAIEIAARAHKTSECAAATQQLEPSFEAAAQAIRASMA